MAKQLFYRACFSYDTSSGMELVIHWHVSTFTGKGCPTLSAPSVPKSSKAPSKVNRSENVPSRLKNDCYRLPCGTKVAYGREIHWH